MVKRPGRPNVVLPPLEVFLNDERRAGTRPTPHLNKPQPGLPKARRKDRSTMRIDPHDSPFEGRTSTFSSDLAHAVSRERRSPYESP